MINPDNYDDAIKNYTWIDIQTMYKLSDEQYKVFIKQTFFVDHHDVLRLERGSDGSPPLATTLEQIDMMISSLAVLRERMVSKSEM